MKWHKTFVEPATLCHSGGRALSRKYVRRPPLRSRASLNSAWHRNAIVPNWNTDTCADLETGLKPVRSYSHSYSALANSRGMRLATFWNRTKRRIRKLSSVSSNLPPGGVRVAEMPISATISCFGRECTLFFGDLS